ncbi:MBL fold metallo-hydrolase [Amycolatopsis taiwanensis]|uniref:MBL fold metallo-hydrolase n=1 Tax=Amycolatopsis taiwanensis TaxID=342230 RepID=A0A9W6VBF6_9PSEU|nr:MBL fold metallo-hydrolase [Amycolatopsis taiwanensis]GLY64913.1 MBL fold metallo-hydrolase [Amycolatopsis taiwanensis]
MTFAGAGDAFGSGGRLQACVHIERASGPPVLLDCGATSMTALKRLQIEPNELAAVFVSHLHGDHFGGLPFLILDGQFRRRTQPLVVAGPVGLRARLAEAMEVCYPGSSTVRRKFEVEVVELQPGEPASVAGIGVSAWEVDHASGAPPLALRLDVDDVGIAYTGDTAWTDAIVRASAGAGLLIAECYYLDKEIPYHLNHRTLLAHRDDLDCARVILTHMSADMLSHLDEAAFEAAHDGLTVELKAHRRS